MPSKTEKSVITQLFPEVPFTLRTGEQIIIKPVPLPKLHQFYTPLANLFKSMEATVDDVNDISKVVDAFTKFTKEFIPILSIALDKPVVWFEGVTINDGIKLVMAVMEVNEIEDLVKNALTLIEKIKVN